MEDLETSATLDFHGARYVVTVQVQQQQLLDVQVEAADVTEALSSVWTGRFQAADIEQLTRQTGNSKRFSVFVQMLLTALNKSSEAVFVDLLTAADLDLYRQRKLQPGAAMEGLTSAATTSSTGKRFLILTYAVEFDRVHYPLPLTSELSPSTEVLQRTNRRLRQALKKFIENEKNNTTLAQENEALKEENRCLKNALKQHCDKASNEEIKGMLASDERFRDEAGVEIAHLRTEIKELRRASQENERTEQARLEKERLDISRKIKDSDIAVEATLAQLVQMKAQLEESQMKNRDLLRQLAIARAQRGQQDLHQRSGFNGSRGSDKSSLSFTGTSPSPRQLRSSARGMTRESQTKSASFPTPLHSPSSSPCYGSCEDQSPANRSSWSSRRRRPSTRPAAFRRFDPTAYQLEKERKQREARARSSSRSRPPRPHPTGYSSDSSAGGYSSTTSRGSKASSRSTRSRESHVSREHQRQVDARLASPKRVMAHPDVMTRPRKSPTSRSSVHRGRSPVPSLPSDERNSHTSRRCPSTSSRDSSPAPQQAASPRQRTQSSAAVRRGKTLPQALLDVSPDSFSDIDDRLTALQQFLREAKQGRIEIAETGTAA